MRGTGATTTYFKTPRPKGGTSKRMVVIALMTLLIPPVGLICLWRARCPFRGKLIVSLLGFASLTLIFTLYLGRNVPTSIQIPVEFQYVTGTAETPAPEAQTAPVDPNAVVPEVQTSDGGIDPAVNPDEPGGTEAPQGGAEPTAPEGVIPANPAG